MPKKSRKRSLTEEDQESAPSSPAKKTKTRVARSRPEVSSPNYAYFIKVIIRLRYDEARGIDRVDHNHSRLDYLSSTLPLPFFTYTINKTQVKV